MINTWEFWASLAAAVVVYWSLPAKMRLSFLALASGAYISYLDVSSAVILLLGSLVIKWMFDCNLLLGKKPALLKWVVILLILGLASFKALPNLLEDVFHNSILAGVAVPLGISYYIFKLIHYAVERNRGNLDDVGNAEFLCWLFLFPMFTAGPIEPLDHFKKSRSENFDHAAILEGLGRIIQGMVKKLVLVGILLQQILMDGQTVMSVHQGLGAMAVYELWIFFVLMFFTFYLEFSAYSDIAIGGCRLFGIKIIENFNWPIVAKNMSEFWKRWHMSLSGWCQRYIYMPVIARTRNPYYAIFFTFLTIGMWHAVDLNYLAWGLFHGAGVAVAVTFGRIRRKLGWMKKEKGIFVYWGIPLTLAYVSFGGVFSSTQGLGLGIALDFAKKLLGV